MIPKKVILILAIVVLILISGCTEKDTSPPTGKTTEENQPSSSQTTTKISTTPSDSKSSSPTTVILEQIYDESGGMSTNGACCDLYIGDFSNGITRQAFLSFDIKNIPANAIITEAVLDFSDYGRTGDPFSSLGCMEAYEQNFGAVDKTDFFYAKPTGGLSKWCAYGDLKKPFSSQELMSALQSRLGQSRFQIRIQMEKLTDGNNQQDYIGLTRHEKLRITYSAQTTTKITATPSVSRSSSPTTVILEQIYDESGGMTTNGGCCDLHIGDYSNGITWQTFLSFDIKSIPANATITEAKLDFSDYMRDGDPFSSLGCMEAYEQNFGAVDKTDFFYAKPTGTLSKWCAYGDLKEPFSSPELMSALQSKLGQSRFQIRIQMEKLTDGNNQEDSITLTRHEKLRITY